MTEPVTSSTGTGARRVRASGRGAAAAEVAAVMPALISMVLGLAWLLSLAVTQARVVDAAREAARVASRSDSADEALVHGRLVAPPGAIFSIGTEGDLIVVEVRAKALGPSGLFAHLPTPWLKAMAVTVREDR